LQSTVEAVKCPECGSAHLIRDNATGEVVCADCGLVVHEVEAVQGFVPKGPDRGSFEVLNALGSGRPTPSEVRRGGRFLRYVGRYEEKAKREVAMNIETVADKIHAPKEVRKGAMAIAKRLLKAMREQNRKFRVEEVSAVSLWCACKVAGHAVTMDEYAEVVEPYISRRNGGKVSLLKLINRAESIAPLPKVVKDARAYIVKFASKLEGQASPKLASAVASYAVTLYEEAADDVSGKDPVCLAATALCVADELMGGWIGRRRILELTGAGFSQSAAEAMKRRAPPPSKNLLDVYIDLMEKKFAEVMAYEDAGNAPR